MKKFFIILTMLLCSCINPQETSQDYSGDDVQDNQQSDGANYHETLGGSPSSCHDVMITKVIKVQGKNIVVEIPVLCENQGIDKGDPPPDDKKIEQKMNEIHIEQNQNSI